MAFVTENRRRGSADGCRVAANMALVSPVIRRAPVGPTDDSRPVRWPARRRPGIKAASLDLPVRNLSGGNQQKVVLAKWPVGALDLHPRRADLRIDVGASSTSTRSSSISRAGGGILSSPRSRRAPCRVRPHPGLEPRRCCGLSRAELTERVLAAAFREQEPHDHERGQSTDLLLRNATLIIFVAVFAWFAIGAGNFFSAENLLNVFKQASFTGVIAVGMTFVLLTAGIDLSVGSNMYVSAMVVGYVLMLPGLQGTAGAFVGIVAGLGAGAAFGAINAFSVVYLRITPFLATPRRWSRAMVSSPR